MSSPAAREARVYYEIIDRKSGKPILVFGAATAIAPWTLESTARRFAGFDGLCTDSDCPVCRYTVRRARRRA